MVALGTPTCSSNFIAQPFCLKSVSNEMVSLDDVKGIKGLLVMFICNHCPYVKCIIDKIVRDTNELLDYGIGSVAIMPNDVNTYPDDSFAYMQKLSNEKSFSFPYLFDETQSVAHAYGAVCTPDFFGFNSDLQLKYRGRLDASRTDCDADHPRELFTAMKEISKNGACTSKQISSIGCSIKWKTNNIDAVI